jgi:hypothetical protein
MSEKGPDRRDAHLGLVFAAGSVVAKCGETHWFHRKVLDLQHHSNFVTNKTPAVL